MILATHKIRKPKIKKKLDNIIINAYNTPAVKNTQYILVSIQNKLWISD